MRFLQGCPSVGGLLTQACRRLAQRIGDRVNEVLAGGGDLLLELLRVLLAGVGGHLGDLRSRRVLDALEKTLHRGDDIDVDGSRLIDARHAYLLQVAI